MASSTAVLQSNEQVSRTVVSLVAVYPELAAHDIRCLAWLAPVAADGPLTHVAPGKILRVRTVSHWKCYLLLILSSLNVSTAFPLSQYPIPLKFKRMTCRKFLRTVRVKTLILEHSADSNSCDICARYMYLIGSVIYCSFFLH